MPEIRTERIGSHLVTDDTRVFDGLELRDGTAAGTRLRDDVWDFGPLITTPGHGPSQRMNFGRMTDPAMRRAVKEYTWLRIHRGWGMSSVVRPHTALVEARTLCKAICDLRMLVGIGRLQDITQDHLDRLLVYLREDRGLSPARVLSYVLTLQQFAGAGNSLSGDRIAIAPWGFRSAARIARMPIRLENFTPEIPGPVLEPLLMWAEWYVMNFADEIIAAIEQATSTESEPCVIATANSDVPRWLQYVAYLRRVGCGFPTGRLHRRQPRDIGFHAATHPLRRHIKLAVILRQVGYKCETRALIEWEGWAAALDELGTDVDVAQEAARTSGHVTLIALRGLSLKREAAFDEAIYLQTACLILNAYYSGMRISEILSEEVGCALFGESDDGLSQLPLVRSRLHKHRAAGGRVEDWQVHDLVHDAVHVLERLHTARRAPKTTPLYYNMRRAHLRMRCLTRNAAAERLNDFRDHVNELAATWATLQPNSVSTNASVTDRLPPIPLWNGETWNFTPQQFRETMLSRIVATGGIIAGALQAKHRSARTVLGYASRGANSLLRETESRREIAEVDMLRELYDDHLAGTRLQGKKGEEVSRELQAVADAVGERNVTEAELRDMLRSRFKRVYAGALNLCFYDAERALCRKHGDEQAKKDGPLIGACQPGMCPNALITKEHLPAWAWQQRAAQLYLDANGPRMSPPQLVVLRRNRDEAVTIQQKVTSGLPLNEQVTGQ